MFFGASFRKRLKTSFQIRGDISKYEALICSGCWHMLEEADTFFKNVKRNRSIKAEKTAGTEIVYCRCCLVPSTIDCLSFVRHSKLLKFKKMYEFDVSVQ